MLQLREQTSDTSLLYFYISIHAIEHLNFVYYFFRGYRLFSICFLCILSIRKKVLTCYLMWNFSCLGKKSVKFDKLIAEEKWIDIRPHRWDLQSVIQLHGDGKKIQSLLQVMASLSKSCGVYNNLFHLSILFSLKNFRTAKQNI